jgi:outer membrane protein insertion porin family
LIVIIDEGRQYHIKDIAVPNFIACEQEPFFVSLCKAIRKGEKVLLNDQVIADQKQALLSYFVNHGYLYPQIKLEIEECDNSSVRVIWHIEPGQQARFGKTIIRASSAIPYEYIKASLAYKQGDIWEHQKIRKTFLNLKNLEIFESIGINHVQNFAHDGDRTLIVNIPKDDPYELRLRGGLELLHIKNYSTFGGVTYKFGGTFLIKNPFNQADQINASADITKTHREVSVKYIKPFLGTIPLKSTLQAYSIRYEQPGFIGGDKNIYTAAQNGILLGLSKTIEHCDTGLNVGFEWAQTRISDQDDVSPIFVQQLANAIDFAPQLLGDQIPYVFVEPTLFLDFLDNKLAPTKGFLTLVTLKGMFACNNKYKQSSFIKMQVEQSAFKTFWSVVLGLRLRFGHIFYQTFKTITPIERFYLGGSRSVRGYDTDLMPPLGFFVDEKGKEYIVPRGGRSMININIESRIPLLKNITGVIFQDFGLLCGDDIFNANVNDVGAATGFGLRIGTPVGPLRFDIGWKWRRTMPHERRFAWFLTFGQAF